MKKITLEKFTTNGECMGMAAQLSIKATVFRDVTATDVIAQVNTALSKVDSPYEIQPEDDKIHFLRFEEGERMDRVLYILSCLVDYSKNRN